MDKNCDICNKIFVTKQRGRTRKYCSQKCYNIKLSISRPYNYKGDIESICNYCKKTHFVSRSAKKKHCSRQCYDLSRLNGFTVDKILEMAKSGKKYIEISQITGIEESSLSRLLLRNNHKRHANQKNYRFIALNNIQNPQCKNCKYDEYPQILVVHHIDGNRENNLKENLCVLCPNCHALAHLTEKGVNYRKLNEKFILHDVSCLVQQA